MTINTRSIVLLAILTIFLSPAQGAISLETATLQNGAVLVKGKGAVLGAQITWDNALVTTANTKNGGFSFYAVVPDDCRGELSDGAETAQIDVLYCTPAETGPLVPVFETGQTTSFYPFDDGYYQKGISRPADSARFILTGQGTVLDKLTGLSWLRRTDCVPVAGDDWETAIFRVSAINSGSIDCGDTSNAGSHQTDWRLPNLNELMSLMNINTVPQLARSYPFIITGNSAAWTSTTSQHSAVVDEAYFVNIFSGEFHSGDKKETFNLLFAVRDGL